MIKMKIEDFKITGHGSIYLIHPKTPEAEKFLHDRAPEDAQFLSKALVVEHRYIELWVRRTTMKRLSFKVAEPKPRGWSVMVNKNVTRRFRPTTEEDRALRWAAKRYKTTVSAILRKRITPFVQQYKARTK